MSQISKVPDAQVWSKAALYAVAMGALTTTVAYATLDAQVTKISDLVLGKVATMIVGGGLAAGGGYSLVSGNLMKGAGQLCVAALIGIGVWWTKSGTIFSGLS